MCKMYRLSKITGQSSRHAVADYAKVSAAKAYANFYTMYKLRWTHIKPDEYLGHDPYGRFVWHIGKAKA